MHVAERLIILQYDFPFHFAQKSLMAGGKRIFTA